MSKDRLSRRDFIKLAGTALGTTTLPHSSNLVDIVNQVSWPVLSPQERIETGLAENILNNMVEKMPQKDLGMGSLEGAFDFAQEKALSDPKTTRLSTNITSLQTAAKLFPNAELTDKHWFEFMYKHDGSSTYFPPETKQNIKNGIQTFFDVKNPIQYLMDRVLVSLAAKTSHLLWFEQKGHYQFIGIPINKATAPYVTKNFQQRPIVSIQEYASGIPAIAFTHEMLINSIAQLNDPNQPLTDQSRQQPLEPGWVNQQWQDWANRLIAQATRVKPVPPQLTPTMKTGIQALIPQFKTKRSSLPYGEINQIPDNLWQKGRWQIDTDPEPISGLAIAHHYLLEDTSGQTTKVLRQLQTLTEPDLSVSLTENAKKLEYVNLRLKGPNQTADFPLFIFS